MVNVGNTDVQNDKKILQTNILKTMHYQRKYPAIRNGGRSTSKN